MVLLNLNWYHFFLTSVDVFTAAFPGDIMQIRKVRIRLHHSGAQVLGRKKRFKR